MKRRWLPRSVVGGLLVGSFLAWAANGLSSQPVTGPSLSAIYKLADSQQVSVLNLTNDFIDAAISQQQMSVLQDRLAFYQNELKQAKSSAGVFSHVDQNLESSLDTDIDLARAAFYGAQLEWKNNVGTLSQAAGQYYESVQPIAANFHIEIPPLSAATKSLHELAAQLLQQKTKVTAEQKALEVKQYDYARGYIKITDITAQGLKYYQAQETYWNLAGRYLHAVVDSEAKNNKLSVNVLQRLNDMLYQPEKFQSKPKIVKHRKRRHEELVEQHKPVTQQEAVVVHKSIVHKTIKPMQRQLVALPMPKTEMQPIKISALVRQENSYVEPRKFVAKISPLTRQENSYVEPRKLAAKISPLARQENSYVEPPRLAVKISPLTRQATAYIEPKNMARRLVKLPAPKLEPIKLSQHHKSDTKTSPFYILPEPVSTRFNYIL